MTDNEMESRLAEMARIEKLKGPRNPSLEHQYFRPARKTQQQLEADAAEADRHEALKKNPVLPPRQPRDFIADKREQMQRDARKEQLIAATGGRLG